MFDTVKDYAFSVYFHSHDKLLNRKEKVKDTVTTYTSKSEVDKILVEATANENWNIANSKL
jgi:hypothetical protein